VKIFRSVFFAPVIPLVLGLFLPVFLYPQEGREPAPVFNYPLTAETLKRFTSVCGELSEHPVIRGAFEQTKTIMRLKRTLVSSGDFIIAPELGMVWDTKKPFASIMAVGSDFITQSTPSGAKTKMNAQGNETFLSLADSISAVFTGNSQRLLDNFENYFVEGGDGGSWTLGLIPKEKSIRSFAARIIISGGRTKNDEVVMRSINLYEQNGDTIQYVLSDHSFSERLSTGERSLFSVQ
jgi:hypothetical protein